MTAPWLSILGIGEEGVDGLSAAARSLLAGATVVFGGARHLDLAAPLIQGEAIAWPSPMAAAYPAVTARHGQPVAVLASGNPFCFGVGSALARLVPMAEITCIPAASAFALACARLGWAQQDTATISFCGRPLEPLLPLLQPGARILALSADAATPEAVASLLCRQGFGPTRMHLLQALGGPREAIRTATAETFSGTVDPLNLLALEILPGPAARIIPLTAGLPEEAFEHDGQITRKEIRAITLAALAPCQGELLWDIGAGSGSVGIEWMLRHRANRAIALEPRADRAARAARNAVSLGVPGLQLVQAAAPEGLAGLPQPDAVFLGGGATAPGVLDTAWSALRPGGRLVANAVTVETEALLIATHSRLGGSLTRIGVERLDKVGRLHGYRPGMTVTQFLAVKP